MRGAPRSGVRAFSACVQGGFTSPDAAHKTGKKPDGLWGGASRLVPNGTYRHAKRHIENQ